MEMHYRLIVSTFSIFLSGATAVAQDTAMHYGPARVEAFHTPNIHPVTKKPASFNVHILPWRKAPNATLDNQMQNILSHPPPGEEYDLSHNTPESLTFVPISTSRGVSLPVGLKAEHQRERQAMFIACNYKGKKQHYREMAFYGDVFGFLAVGKEKVFDQFLAHANKLCNQNPNTARSKAIQALITTAPGKGDGAERLSIVAYSWSTGSTGSGLFQMHEWTDQLFNDGWGRRSTNIPLTEFNVNASRVHEPEKWYRWRKDANGELEIQRHGKTSWRKLDAASYILPAAKGTTYDGRFEYWQTSGDTINNTSVRNDAYIMRQDGTYTSTSFRMAESNLGNSSVNTVNSSSGNGCSSATSIGGDLVGGSNTSNTQCGNGKSGTYMIDGYVITLSANNGVTRSFPFYANNKNQFTMHGKTFSLSNSE